MTPNLDLAAPKAAEIIIKHHITTGPLDPFPVLKSMHGVVVLSYAEMALNLNLDRANLLDAVNPETHDAMSFTTTIKDRLLYFVVYNQRLPFYLLQRGLARELGHIVLGHDGSRPESVRITEAQTFAYHFLCPRPLVRAVQESGIRFSTEVLGNMTGCFERCLAGMRKTPGTHVPAALNRAVKQQFASYITDFLDFQSIVSDTDEARDADFGTFMYYYEE